MATQTTTVTVDTLMRDMAHEYAKFQNERDINKLLNFYADNARLLPPYRPMVEGKVAIRQALEQNVKEFEPRNLTIETTAVEVHEDLAFSYGTFAVNVALPGGKRMDDRGKWVTIVRHMGGDWRIVCHIYNDDLPLTALMK